MIKIPTPKEVAKKDPKPSLQDWLKLQALLVDFQESASEWTNADEEPHFVTNCVKATELSVADKFVEEVNKAGWCLQLVDIYGQQDRRGMRSYEPVHNDKFHLRFIAHQQQMPKKLMFLPSVIAKGMGWGFQTKFLEWRVGIGFVNTHVEATATPTDKVV